MAKSDSNSNDLRQDQPECIPARGRGVRRVTLQMECGRYRRVFEDTRRPSVTELSGLTSDPILTADRRGGILMYSGPVRYLEAILKASSHADESTSPRSDRGRVSMAPTRPRSR